MSREAPAWFHNAVVGGVQFLWSIGLPGTPAGEVATLTAVSWVQTLWQHPSRWDEQLDTARLAEAFTTVAGRTDRWPAPRQVLDALPPRQSVPALPHHGTPPPPELRDRIRRLTGRMTAPNGPSGDGA